MTAEIAIENRQAIALAADSAVTIGRERVWKYSNKIFSLGPGNDIATMSYNTGEFAGFPWETIIKIFRSERGQKPYNTVTECASDFIDYLSDIKFQPDELNQMVHLALFLEPLSLVANRLEKQKTKKNVYFQRSAIAEC